MSQEKQPDSQESVRQAQWVREHPQIDESAFPEYPDEPMRRGSSRGAVPNGNPWRPVEPDEKPGRPDWEADTLPASLHTDDEPTGPVTPEAPPLGEPTHQPAVINAGNEADERIGRDIGDVLATSKMLDGIHLLVEVVDGDVYLGGTVADQAVRGEVERLSSSVRGVKEIHNELDVRN
ncbi:MAG TPA: BON domain-containing protein [Polyangiaceae bacterium]|nr:BON domain-containing protein [Polyangiaceae bacterium]